VLNIKTVADDVTCPKEIVSDENDKYVKLGFTLEYGVLNKIGDAPKIPRLNHALHVHVVRFEALAGVLFKYADALARNRKELVRL